MLENLFSGFIQGVTEFLPVSSSGHLFLFSNLFKYEVSLNFAIWLHVATLFALILYLRKEIFALTAGVFRLKPESWKTLIALGVGTIPAAVIGFLIKDRLEALFSNSTSIGVCLLITGSFLFASDFLPEKNSLTFGDIGAKYAFIIGLFQGVALLPGISRSGVTLVGALLIGLKREDAFRFSFLLSIPAILGSSLIEMKNLSFTLPMVFGFFAAFFTAFLSLWILKKLTMLKKLRYFAFYCWVIGILAIVF